MRVTGRMIYDKSCSNTTWNGVEHGGNGKGVRREGDWLLVGDGRGDESTTWQER